MVRMKFMNAPSEKGDGENNVFILMKMIILC